MKSIFEKIIDKEIPSKVLYEDDSIICLLDIDPKRLGHTLIVPKIKKTNILLEDGDTIAKMFNVAKKLEKAYTEILGAKGFRISSNINKEGKQIVFHTHLHFIPYYENYDDHSGEMLSVNEFEKIVLKLKN